MITWRKYRQSELYFKDLDAVVNLHLETEAALGHKMQLPNFMEKPVLEAWLGVENDIVLGGYYCEAVVEVCFFGRDPRITASARRQCRGVLASMKQRGFRMVRIECPKWIGQDADSIDKELKAVGFVGTDEHFNHYLFDLTRGD